ncbi:MAG: arginine--tRNA ligase [Actinobacteria bacterium]|nr:arginine--tRNA ligase [Actinomycetota bacterium]
MTTPQELDPVLAELATRIRTALLAAGLPEVAEIPLERPRQPEHGDWATPVALSIAAEAEQTPRAIAEQLMTNLEVPPVIAAVDVAGPGFVNFRLAHSYFQDVVRRVLAEGDRFGRRTRADVDVEHVNVEFVSSNPTGPLHVGHGRWAAAGDAIAALLEADGHHVEREYYLNDTGEQIRRFGESVVAAGLGRHRTDEHYRGEYVDALAAQIKADLGDAVFGGGDDAEVAERIGQIAVELMTDHIRDVLHTMGVDFDTWFSERSLHEQGAVQATVDLLAEAGHVHEEDGAVFLNTTAFGDDKDRVLVRSDGRPTYFAADCAYLQNKRERGHDRFVYLLGADHHGYVGRMQALGRALGVPDETLEIRIGQLVNLSRGGQPVRMSTRAGEFVTLAEVLDEVGRDALRYHYLRSGLDQPIDFDLDEVVRQSMDNPVYYVQYAHARIASILRNADAAGFDAGTVDDAALDLLTEPTEEELLRRMAELPEVVAQAADLRAPHRLTRYAEDLAGSFHRFYTECRVLGVRDDIARARYWLAVAAKQVLATALALLRVSAPERM